MTRWLMLVSSLDELDGGPPRAVLRVSEALIGAGDVVTVVSAREHAETDGPGIARALAAGVRIQRGSVRRRTRFRFSWSMARRAYTASASADVVCVHSFYQFSCVLAWIVARRRGIPLLVQPHGVFEPYQEAQGRRHKDVFMQLVGHRIVRETGAVLTCSVQEEVGVAKSLGRLAPATVVVGLGVDPTSTPRAVTWGRRLLFLSRVAPKKRLDLVLDAVMELHARGQAVTLTVCGDGDPDLISRLQAINVPRGLVTWRGHVTGDDVASALASHDLFVLPSDNENYAMAVTEALAAGLPVVTSDQTGASEHVAKADAGWVLHDPDGGSLADAVDTALADTARLAAMSVRGRVYAEGELTWRAVAQRWSGILTATPTTR